MKTSWSLPSLHKRLTIILCCIAAVLGLLGSLASFWVDRSLGEDFDTSLRNAAIEVSRNGLSASSSQAAPHVSPDLVVQIWEASDAVHPIRSTDPLIALPRTAPGLSVVMLDGEAWDVFSMHAEVSFVQIGERRSVRRHNAERLATSAALPIILLLPLLALTIGVIVRISLRPLDRMGRLAAAIDLNNLHALDATGAPNELRPFLDSINRMINRLAQSLDAERIFISNAAHELRTPISALQLQLDALRHAPSAEQAARIDDLQRGIFRIGSLVAQLLGLARAEMGRDASAHGDISLPQLVAEVVADLLPLALNRQVDLGALHLEPISFRAVEADLRILLKNLIDNAIYYGGRGAHVDVSVLRQDDMAVLEVTDDGPGIPAEQMPRIFDRFFRGGASAEAGSGLGLAIIAAISSNYGGRVTLVNRSDGKTGIIARVELPLGRSEAPTEKR